MRRLIGFVLIVLLCALLTIAQGGTRYRVDYGAWRVIVLQSDDWGLEAWFPDASSAAAMRETLVDLPERLAPYATSTLETPAEVDSLAQFLGSMRDADNLPAILQANTIVAAVDPAEPTADAAAPSFGFTLRQPGDIDGAYARPGLWEAFARAQELGVWRIELHGLTHRDLESYADAWRAKDPLLRRASALGVVAHEGWLRRHELAKGDRERAHATLAEAYARFERLAGHPPVSFIAPDYHWDEADERALATLGVRVIQAKSEQIHPRWARSGWIGRLSKRLTQLQQRRTGNFLYMDRPARLEPYGESDPTAPQGAAAAARAIREAWRRGEPGVVSVHRLQLSHPVPEIAAAGRAQLAALFEELDGVGSLRILVDAEIAALERGGISKLRRGTNMVYRNFGKQARWIVLDGGARTVLSPGTIVLPAEAE